MQPCGLRAKRQNRAGNGGKQLRVERQWKKETKEKYTPWVQQMEKIWEDMKRRQKEIEDENK